MTIRDFYSFFSIDICFPFKVPKKDSRFQSGDCKNLVRASAATDDCDLPGIYMYIAVKLTYNELGYNEFTVIMGRNKFLGNIYVKPCCKNDTAKCGYMNIPLEKKNIQTLFLLRTCE